MTIGNGGPATRNALPRAELAKHYTSKYEIKTYCLATDMPEAMRNRLLGMIDSLDPAKPDLQKLAEIAQLADSAMTDFGWNPALQQIWADGLAAAQTGDGPTAEEYVAYLKGHGNTLYIFVDDDNAQISEMLDCIGNWGAR